MAKLKIACIGAGYVVSVGCSLCHLGLLHHSLPWLTPGTAQGGPTMAMIAYKCPDIQVVVVDINEARISGGCYAEPITARPLIFVGTHLVQRSFGCLAVDHIQNLPMPVFWRVRFCCD